MSAKDYVAISFCAALTLLIIYVMYSNSQLKETFENPKESPQKAEDNYEKRMFVIKTYESIGKKVPSEAELARAASLGSNEEILKHILNSSTEERFVVDSQEDDVFGPVSIDADDVFLRVDTEKAKPRGAVKIQEEIKIQQQEIKVQNHDGEKPQRAKDYIREIYMLLGKLDDCVEK